MDIFRKPNPKARRLGNHFSIDVPNFMHQIDLLHLPNDIGFRYCLTVVDCASRYKGAKALRNKTAIAVLTALEAIYESDKFLRWPAIVNADLGGEFAKVKRECEERGFAFRPNEKSNHLAFVESFNNQLAKRLFEPMSEKEIATGRVNKEWYKNLDDIVNKMNRTTTRMIKMKPIDAIQLENVPQPANNFSEKDLKKRWPIGTRVRRLLNSDEVLDVPSGRIKVERRRATDPYWSLVEYTVSALIRSDGRLIEHEITADNDVPYPHLFTYYQLRPV